MHFEDPCHIILAASPCVDSCITQIDLGFVLQLEIILIFTCKEILEAPSEVTQKCLLILLIVDAVLP